MRYNSLCWEIYHAPRYLGDGKCCILYTTHQVDVREGAAPLGNRTQEQHMLVTDFARSTAYSEALRTFYANIRFQWEKGTERPARAHSLLIATPVASGDYAEVAANLAIVAAQSGADTILVDADLRAP